MLVSLPLETLSSHGCCASYALHIELPKFCERTLIKYSRLLPGCYIVVVSCTVETRAAANGEEKLYLAPHRGSPAFAPEMSPGPGNYPQKRSLNSLSGRPLRHSCASGTDISAGNRRTRSKRGATSKTCHELVEDSSVQLGTDI